jgi:hypothetical protein
MAFGLSCPVRVGERLETVLSTLAPDREHGPYTFDWVFYRDSGCVPKPLAECA